MLSLSHTGVQTLLFSLCKGCSFKEPGETACGHSPEGTRWLSPRWRGKSSSLSVLVVNKLEVLYQPLRALHHDESECYKVLIIKTCLCVCVFSKALVVVPVWNHDGTTASFSEVL